MAVITAYFLWIFAGLSAILLLVLVRAVLHALVQPEKSRFSLPVGIFGYILYGAFSATTYIVAFAAGLDIWRWQYPYPLLVGSWSDSAQLALLNLTLFSILAALALGLFRAWRSLAPSIAPAPSLLSGRVGQIVNVLVSALSVVSSLISLGVALIK